MAVGAMTIIGLGWWYSSAGYQGPVSDHFDGREFHNIRMPSVARKRSILRWTMTRQKIQWPNWVTIHPGTGQPAPTDPARVVITFINHATVLIQWNGKSILTDPMFSDRASPISWLGPHRVHAPGIPRNQLPKIDAIWLSHNHYDHLDIPTLKWVCQKNPELEIVTGLGNQAYLRRYHIKNKIHELDWWDTATVATMPLTFVPAQHFSARGTVDRNRTLWGGIVWQSPNGPVYFAGDTGMGPWLDEVANRIGPVWIGLIPIGAYAPRYMMQTVHVDPEAALTIHRRLNCQTSIAIHWGCFQLTDEGRLDPVNNLARAKKPNDAPFIVLEPGASLTF